MKKTLIAFVFSTLISTSTVAGNDIDQSLLIGNWCYQSITAKGSSESKPINTEWVFLDDGKVIVQSEWMKKNKSTLPYELENGRIKIPKMNKKYEVSKLTDTEMILVNAHGMSENMFLRGECE